MNGNRRRIRDPLLTLAGVFKLMFGILKKGAVRMWAKGSPALNNGHQPNVGNEVSCVTRQAMAAREAAASGGHVETLAR